MLIENIVKQVKVSIYVKGDRNSTAYYRIYQYLDRIEGIKCRYHLMMAPSIHNRFMPIFKQNLLVKSIVYIHVYFRMLWALINDLLDKPDAIVVHKRIISRYMPLSYKWLVLLILKRNVQLIWDFDDHILNNKEVTVSTFNFFSQHANAIIVTHDYLKSLILEQYQPKVHILPTTDGDMYEMYRSEDLNAHRIHLLNEGCIYLVWVATSVNLKHLESIIDELDNAAFVLAKDWGKHLSLKVVCDAPLLHKCQHLKVENIKWTRKDAVMAMKDSHIGIMPLDDSIFSKGKGGFKLVQYLSIGLPCIGTNVGYNKQVISENCGYLIDYDKPEGWTDAILKLVNPSNWQQLSRNAYLQWETNFSYDRNLAFWRDLLLSAEWKQ